MMRTDRQGRLPLRPGDKVAVVAGGGRLPVDLAESLAAHGHRPFVVMVAGEAAPGLEAFDHEEIALEDFAGFAPLLKRHGVTHAVLAGSIDRRPRLRAIKLSLPLLAFLPRVLAALAKGDDSVLRTVVGFLEGHGVKVVGAHEILPDLLVVEGLMTGRAPRPEDQRDIAAATAAARAIGALDIGQGAVAVGGRVIALEGIEGTDALLERVRELRTHGRIAGKRGGVLVKCAKRGQELRADLPAIGPTTIVLAHAAGLAGVGVEAHRSLVLDFAGVAEQAEKLGLFVVGLPRENAP